MRIEAQAIQQYTRLEGVNPSEKAGSTAARQDEQPSVKLKNTRFGFDIGGFGLEYSSSDLELDASLDPSVAQNQKTAQTYTTESDVQSLRVQMVSSMPDRYDSVNAGAESVNLRRTAGLAAYARSSQPESPLPGSMFAALA